MNPWLKVLADNYSEGDYIQEFEIADAIDFWVETDRGDE